MAPIYISEPIKLSFSIIPVDSVGHNVVEVISSHEAVVVQISLCKHLIELLIGHVFPEILGNFLQLHHSNFPILMNIKGCKDFVDFSPAVLVAELGSRKSQKLWEIDSSRLIFIEFCQDLVDKLVLTTKAEIDEGLF